MGRRAVWCAGVLDELALEFDGVLQRDEALFQEFPNGIYLRVPRAIVGGNDSRSVNVIEILSEEIQCLKRYHVLFAL